MTDTFDFFEQQFECPICHSDKVVPPFGPKKSSILIVAEFPAEIELKEGKPMVGPMGTVLRQELMYLGLDIKTTRRMNIWRHPPNKNKDCFNLGVEEVIKEAKGKQAILLFGDEVVKKFIDKSVMSIMGLNVKSIYFSAPVIVCCSNPAVVYQRGRGVGEVRLSLKKFADYIKEIEYE
jgi:uracil-DNA glycosylase family 4